MYMRGRFFSVTVLVVLAVLLSACQRQINSPGDELSMYTWRGELDSGASAELSFDGDDGFLTVNAPDFTLDIGGLYVYTDDTLIICDRNSDLNYSFVYTVHGDRVELDYSGAAISLDKVE